ncbi:hypothetical protein BHF71_02475 [Vulcanibacillus modesticaldus]|uniref:Metallo-beta-lactamase domain-containing protein n=1 Tax=Vulcanibacillus modesticaldus TaxID=337097 RepID=A0A1D2YTQ6_9BACI|nr:MBL fold metallo-hydrolase [Vulcanibacillus modesticaldus]OEF99067.1 hypothetical protein BHF71_02475 [Vulcanibacillus modesticaldus]
MKLIKLVLLIILFFIILNFYHSFTLSKVPNINVDYIQSNQQNIEYNELLVSFLPLSIGEATIVQLPTNDFYLIDTGSIESAEQLILLMNMHGITKLRGIILTNFSEEHIGGLNAVLDKYAVDFIYIPELIASEFKLPENQKFEIKMLKEDDVIKLYPNVKIVVMAPSDPLSLSPQANSLVFQLIHKNVKFLFTSDINEEIELKLIDKYQLKSEILKVSDFGSNIGSNPEFLEEVDAQVGIIFSNDPNLYKISDDVLERLNESWIDVYVLKRQGEIQILSDGDYYQVEVIKIEK